MEPFLELVWFFVTTCEIIFIIASFGSGVLVNYMLNNAKYWNLLIITCVYLLTNSLFHLALNLYCKPYKSGVTPKHLIMVVPGYLGHYNRSKGIQDYFKHRFELQARDDRDDRDDIMVYISKENSNGFFMYTFHKNNDGIKKGGKRLYDEIKNILTNNKAICKISIIGCSLGGIYARYCLKLLFNSNSNSNSNSNRIKHNGRIIQAMNFITLACPHIGIQDSGKRKPFIFFSKSVSWYDATKKMDKYHVLPKTFQEMAIFDKDNLLIKMACVDEYLVPLQSFKNRVCFSNVMYDDMVTCRSALMLYDVKQVQFITDFCNKMKNEKFWIKELTFIKQNRDDNKNNIHNDVWFKKLGDKMIWQKIIVCWNQNRWTRSGAHTLLVSPSIWYSGGKAILDKMHQTFYY